MRQACFCAPCDLRRCCSTLCLKFVGAGFHVFRAGGAINGSHSVRGTVGSAVLCAARTSLFKYKLEPIFLRVLMLSNVRRFVRGRVSFRKAIASAEIPDKTAGGKPALARLSFLFAFRTKIATAVGGIASMFRCCIAGLRGNARKFL